MSWDVRRAAADDALAHSDFGDQVVKDVSGWEGDGSDRLTCPVFLEAPFDAPSTRVTFVVEFHPGSSEVQKSYIESQ